jgi:mono/diheme cytochrome c family protein
MNAPGKDRVLRTVVIAALCVVLTGWLLLLPSSAAHALAATPQTEVQTGAQQFVDSGCAQCHGAQGLGTAKGPTLRSVRRRLSAAQVRLQIKDGGKSMPPFEGALTEAQIAALTDFLRSKSAWREPMPPPSPAPPA